MSDVFVFEQLEAVGDLVGVGSTAVDRAAQIVSEAEARAAEIEAAARRDGFAAGLAEGAAHAAAEARSSLDAVAAAVDAVRGEALAALELRAAEVALLVAERILTAALDVRPELVCEVVASSLRRVADAERLVLDVNPDDADRVRSWLDDGNGAHVAPLELRAERRVPRGGCVVRTPEVEIDARIGVQLERAGELVREALGSQR